VIELGTIMAVVVGGPLSLLGTVLANYLQYCREREDRKKDRMRERVQRYLAVFLELADWVCVVASSFGGRLKEGEYAEWQEMGLLGGRGMLEAGGIAGC